MQLACAALVLGRRSSVLAGLGLLGLYAAAVIDHGWFHLLDYPVFAFIGVALVAPWFSGREDAERTLALLRWGAGITLLWGGVEKFAYPEWSFAMLSADTAYQRPRRIRLRRAVRGAPWRGSGEAATGGGQRKLEGATAQ